MADVHHPNPASLHLKADVHQLKAEVRHHLEQNIMVTLMILIETVLSVSALLFVVQLAFSLWVRTRNERFLGAQRRLQDAASATVKEVQQTLAHDMKMARVEQRLKGDTAAELRSTAIKIMHANLGPLGLRELRRSLGLKRKTPLDRLLVGHIEAALFDIKRSHPKEEKNEIPSALGKRFYPETMRIPKVDKTQEDPPENLFDEPTKVTRG
jgi:hypothetical protein